MKLELPWPPSVNHYWGRRGNWVYIKQAGKDFRDLSIWKIKEARVEMIKGPAKVTLHLYPPDRRKRDTDNVLKALFDALQHGGAIEDDYLIEEHHFYRHEADKPGRVEIELDTL